MPEIEQSSQRGLDVVQFLAGIAIRKVESLEFFFLVGGALLRLSSATKTTLLVTGIQKVLLCSATMSRASSSVTFGRSTVIGLA